MDNSPAIPIDLNTSDENIEENISDNNVHEQESDDAFTTLKLWRAKNNGASSSEYAVKLSLM